MHFRRFFAILTLVLVGGILAACGSEDEADPTPVPTEAAVEPTPTTAADPTVEPTDEATEAAASPMASPVASPVVSPVIAGTPDGDSTSDIVPMPNSESEATPTSDSTTNIVPMPAGDLETTPTEVAMQDLEGTLTLDGREQVDFTLTEEGCVGVGEWRQLKPGAQVIVKDASGTVVDIAELEGESGGETCTWSFAFSAPVGDYFSVSIPMITEVWFAADDAWVESGVIELFVP